MHARVDRYRRPGQPAGLCRHALDGGGRWLEAPFKGKGLVIVVMSDERLKALLEGGVAIDTNPGSRSAARDVLIFSHERGTFAGALFGGNSIHPRDALNAAYYGQPASPEDILLKMNVGNPSAAELQDVLAKASK